MYRIVSKPVLDSLKPTTILPLVKTDSNHSVAKEMSSIDQHLDVTSAFLIEVELRRVAMVMVAMLEFVSKYGWNDDI